MINEIEKTLCEALSHARIEELPKESTKKAAWTKAIALVTKTTNRQSYVIVRKKDGRIDIVKDFGTTAQIIRIDAVYPYEGAVETPKSEAAEKKAAAPKTPKPSKAANKSEKTQEKEGK